MQEYFKPTIPTVRVDCDGFDVETLMNVRAARAGFTVVEVPSSEHERVHGESDLRPFPRSNSDWVPDFAENARAAHPTVHGPAAAQALTLSV